MSAPTPYARLKNFTDFAIAHPDAPFNPGDLDAELNALLRTVAGLVANRVLIQRDDGALANDSVHPDSLSTATLLLIEAAGSAGGLASLIRGYWAADNTYRRGEIVQYLTTSYICAVDHISSGLFANDYITDKKWIILGETAAAGASALSFSPAGNISAVTVQTAIEELDVEKAKLGGSAGQVFLVGDATGASHAATMGQVQKNSFKAAIGTGTADAILATIPSGLTTLADGMEFVIEAPGTNTITTPTLNLTLGIAATGAKPIVKGNDIPLIAGDIAANKCAFCYDISLDKWVLLNPVFPVGVSSSDVSPGNPKNIGLAFTVGGNALSANVVTATGSTPTSGDQIRVPMRSSNLASGTFNVRTIAAPVGLTISNGSTLGHVNGVAGSIHWYLIDNASSLELAASTKYFGRSGLITTVAEGGAGAADSASNMYSATARANVPFLWIGETTDTQAVAGTWAALPSVINIVPDHVVDVPTPMEVLRISAAVSGNAMTLTLHPCVLDFRSPDLASGAVNRRVVSSPISTTISAGSTGGTQGGVSSRIYLVALDNNGTVELGWVNASGSNSLSEDLLINAAAEGGAGAADSATVIYATAARSGVPFRVVGYVESVQATAGQWVATPTKVQGASPRSLHELYGGLGVNQQWRYLGTNRAVGITYTNTTGKTIVLSLGGGVAIGGNAIQVFINGAVVAQSNAAYTNSAWCFVSGVVIPNGATYAIATSAGAAIAGLTWYELS